MIVETIVMSAKAKLPIDVTELGIFRVCSFDIPAKAPLPIAVTELPIVRVCSFDMP